ncbi:MAG: hypothetical protein ACXWZ8_07390, partial [Gaiellaceae bacterium]
HSPRVDLSSLDRRAGPLRIVYESFHYVALPNYRDLTCTVIQALGEVKPATEAPLKDVQDSIRQQLLQTKKNEAMTKWVDDLKQDYKGKISYATGFNPPPTSSTSTAATTSP